MNFDDSISLQTIDMHCHVGLLGDKYPHWGRFSEFYRKQLVYKVFLIYGDLKESEVRDETLRAKTEEVISGSHLDHVVCLALDPVYQPKGTRREDLSNFWVDNDYVLDLQRTVGEKVLLGASVHPFDPDFENRVRKYVDKGAVLLKWLPSAQQFNLADDRVRDALKFLATCRDGEPLPLLLHAGVEYAIPSTDSRTFTHDFLSWSFWDGMRNFFRKEKWFRPKTKKLHDNLKAGLDAGAVFIFAHCGLPYYAPNFLKKIVEHSDFKTIRRYLKEYPATNAAAGRCFADISACATPFRRSYFGDIRKLPPGSILFGSDFPTPVFELSADLKEVWEDFRAILKGDFKRIIIPEDNLLDVNFRELSHFFPGHPMFTNFSKLLSELKLWGTVVEE
jgi:predicted TIM-barrel fold metal-dependent hydrolase